MENNETKDERCIVLHIPHSVRSIPVKYKDLFYKTDLNVEVNKMVDSYTDELFDLEFDKIIFGTNRLLCDVERFRDDKKEIMAKKGMGICYTKDHNLMRLKECPKKYKEEMLKLYDNHHLKLEEIVSQKLKKHGKCIIIDCHSFSSERLKYEECNENKRPDFCIGLNANEGGNEADRIIRRIEEEKKKVYEDGEWVERNYKIKINSPFSGSIKPLKYIDDKRVISVMIEVNRYLYMDEITGKRNGNFDIIKRLLHNAIVNVDGYYDERIKKSMEYLSTHYVSVTAGACISSHLWYMGATRADFEEMKKHNRRK